MREGFQRGKQLMNFDQSDPQNEVSFVGGYFIRFPCLRNSVPR